MKRPGFTIAEMTVSLGVLGLLTTAMGSLVVLGARTIPDDSSVNTEVATASAAVDMLSSELKMATVVTAGTGAAILFTIPDRNKDAAPETLRYEWSGVRGEPLTRSLNGGTPVNVVGSVQELTFSYILAAATEEVLDAPVTGDETRIASRSDAVVVLYDVDQDDWGAQYFRPQLSADAVSWDITRIRVKLQGALGLGGAVFFSLHLADADGLPAGPAIATGRINAGLLDLIPTYFSIAGLTAAGLPAPAGVCIVAYGTSSLDAGYVCLKNPAAEIVGQAWLASADAGTNWSARSDIALQFQLDATVTTQSTSNVNHQFLRAVDITLRAGDADAPPVRTRVSIVNLPEAP